MVRLSLIWEAAIAQPPNLASFRGRGGRWRFKWLNRQTRQDVATSVRDRSKSPFIIFQKRANYYWWRAKMQPLSHYILLQSWQDRNRNHTKYAAWLLKSLQRLDSHASYSSSQIAYGNTSQRFQAVNTKGTTSSRCNHMKDDFQIMS